MQLQPFEHFLATQGNKEYETKNKKQENAAPAFRNP